MALNNAALNLMGDALAAAAPYLAIHTAAPDASGSNQASSARVAAGWAATSNGVVSASNKAFTGGAASGPAQYVGLWSAATGGTFYGAFALTGDQTFNAAGQYTLNSLNVNGASS